MVKPKDATKFLVDKAQEDREFRESLLQSSRATIEEAFGVKLPPAFEVIVHEESYDTIHVVLPPRDKYSKSERDEAKKGVESLEFLRRTLHDPAPPLRQVGISKTKTSHGEMNPRTLANAARESIQRGLMFLDSTIDQRGAWHCIRFNIAKPEIPRHFERPPFVSALCSLALSSSNEKLAQSICIRTRQYIADTIEYPGLWRYYRHLPTDLDSTALCSLVVDSHPWILLQRNVPSMLGNRDENGLFTTWVHSDDEPDVVSPFRIEADPVVNANLIAYLGDRPETKDAQRWLEASIVDGSVSGASKWYPDPVMAYYATSRAMAYTPAVLSRLRPILAERILDLRDREGRFANVFQIAQAVSALYNIESLNEIDMSFQLAAIIEMQRDDGSWPELLAFGDQSLNWGTFGQIGHGSESITGAFCIEALERLVEGLNA